VHCHKIRDSNSFCKNSYENNKFKWVWIWNFVTMHIYWCTIGVHSFKFFKTPKYGFNGVFMDCIEDVVCTEYFTVHLCCGCASDTTKKNTVYWLCTLNVVRSRTSLISQTVHYSEGMNTKKSYNKVIRDSCSSSFPHVIKKEFQKLEMI
jgi:hypothetical protein